MTLGNHERITISEEWSKFFVKSDRRLAVLGCLANYSYTSFCEPHISP
jgi:hypothetical protein